MGDETRFHNKIEVSADRAIRNEQRIEALSDRLDTIEEETKDYLVTRDRVDSIVKFLTWVAVACVGGLGSILATAMVYFKE